MLNIDDRLIKEVSPKIGPNALSVLLAIAIHLNQKTDRCFPSHNRLMLLTGLGRDTVYKALEKLKSEGLLTSMQLIDSDKKTFGRRSFKLSTRFIKIFVDACDAEPLTENPDTALPDTEEPDTAKQETYQLNNTKQIKNKEQINKECGAPAQKTDFKDFVFPDLEEKKETPQVPAAPSCSHRDKPSEIETHTDLLKQIDVYYKANPEEWKTSVKAMSGPSYTDAQLNEMLQDYVSHSFSRRNPRQTFAQHNADFCRWVKDQKNHAKPTQTPYARPASNKMRTIEVETTGYSADQLF